MDAFSPDFLQTGSSRNRLSLLSDEPFKTRVGSLDRGLEERLKPSFLVIGAQRSGTTSLYRNLCRHPSVLSAIRKEVHFFDHSFDRDISWYLEHFPAGNPTKAITGEASPSYLLHPLAAERAASVFPDVKLIAILRNPIDRAYSHYRHEIRRKCETATFDEALDLEEERTSEERKKLSNGAIQKSNAFQGFSYCTRGRYAEQLEAWLRVFPKDQLRVVISEDFFNNPAQILQGISRFLEIPEWLNADQLTFERFNFGGKAELSSTTRSRLAEDFRGHNQRLSALLRIKLPWDK